MKLPSSPRRRGLVVILAGLAAGCSSAAPPARTTADARERAPDEERTAPGPAGAEPEARPSARCEDGGCFPCGEGFCLTGFYCDLGAKGGPLCSWVPACPMSGCDCLGRELGSCRCESKDGGPHLSCG